MRSNSTILDYAEKRKIAYSRETDPLIGQVLRGEVSLEEYKQKA